jgi:hypothetical protein
VSKAVDGEAKIQHIEFSECNLIEDTTVIKSGINHIMTGMSFVEFTPKLAENGGPQAEYSLFVKRYEGDAGKTFSLPSVNRKNEIYLEMSKTIFNESDTTIDFTLKTNKLFFDNRGKEIKISINDKSSSIYSETVTFNEYGAQSVVKSFDM